MVDIWQAAQYTCFIDKRTRAAEDLLARIPLLSPNIIYDLGCGTGNSTVLLQQRWPAAQIIGIDNSLQMLTRARQQVPHKIHWVEADIATWRPQTNITPDLIFANASLHWLNNHQQLFPRLLSFLLPGGVLAVQMPRNFAAPTHIAIVETIKNGSWCDRLMPLLRYDPTSPTQTMPVNTPEYYYRLIAPLASTVDIWETEYLHVLEGVDPVVEWMKGTGLRPFLAALSEAERQLFVAEYSKRVNNDYPPMANGKTLLPFRRMFMVAVL